MAYFEFTAELRPFAQVGMELEYKISGDCRGPHDENAKVECVEVPGYPGGWNRINQLHPLWTAYWTFINSDKGICAVDVATVEAFEGDYEEVA